MEQTSHKLAILAFGSLVDEPGEELEPLILSKIECFTPFKVEYARLSSTRGNAPTLVPLKEKGEGVRAYLLVLDEKISKEDAVNILWRRETRQVGSYKEYSPPEKPTKNSVTVETLTNFNGIETVLYTAIPQNMGILNTPQHLAYFALQSLLSEAGEKKLDGVHYLQNNINNGIITSVTKEYEQEILKQTRTASLDQAIALLDALRPKHLEHKKEMDAFEKRAQEIADYAFEYGMKTTFTEEQLKNTSFPQLIQENAKKFKANCHAGFKKAQDLSLEIILELQEKQQILKEQLKDAKRAKNKKEISRLQQAQKVLQFKESVIRHIMDGLMWQMIQGQLHISRRIYQEIEGDKVLTQSNIESVKKVVDDINTDPDNFALITDLTSYVQIGDVYGIMGGKFIIGEVKEGERNLKIIEILDEVHKGERSFDEAATHYDLSEKDIEQLHRQDRQHKTMKNFAEIVNEDKGTDKSTGQPIKIITPLEPTPRYTEELRKLEDQLATRNLWVYTVIDDCLHIGMTKGPFRDVGNTLLKSLAEQHTKNYIIVDFLNVLQSLNKPLFSAPFSKKLLFDLLFGRVKLYYMLDLDAFLKLAAPFGLAATWATPKETNKMKSTYGRNKIFELNGRGIKVAELGKEPSKDKESWLSYGSITKMLFEHILPSYTMYSFNYYLKMSEEQESGQSQT